MNPGRIRFLSLVAAALILSAAAYPQTRGILVSGHVYDAETHSPLAGVNIIFGGRRTGTTSNSEGSFKLQVDQLPALLKFSHLGYEEKSLLINPGEQTDSDVYLRTKTTRISQVTISGNRITNLFQSDTLNIIDYEILHGRLIILANPYKRSIDQRLYLATLAGDVLSSRKVTLAGHEIEDQASLNIRKILYLFKDCYGEVQFLTRDRVWQVFTVRNEIYLLYPSTFEIFSAFLFPVKAELDGALFYQRANQSMNRTYILVKGGENYELIKTVFDPYGFSRYARPDGTIATLSGRSGGTYQKSVTSPVIRQENRVAIFDFFGNSIDFFTAGGLLVKTVPISFHLKDYYELLVFKRKDIDQKNFTQQVIYDPVRNRSWSVWHYKSSRRYVLKEVNLDNGETGQVIEIPDFPNIDKIQVLNNHIYFLFTEKTYPYSQTLYRMAI